MLNKNNLKNKIEESIQKDLDAGKYGMICSNETTFKNYVFKKLDIQEETILKKVEDLIIKEILICHHENTPTSRLTSLIMKIKKLK